MDGAEMHAVMDIFGKKKPQAGARLGARCGGAAQAVVDRAAEAGLGDRGHGDGGGTHRIEAVQMRKEIGGRLDQ